VNAPVVAPVVDTHAHYVGDCVIEGIRRQGADRGVRLVDAPGGTRVEVAGRLSGLPLIPPLSDVPARLAWMDAAGVDVQVVAPWMDLAGYDLEGPSGLWLARLQNESAAALVADHPGRFRAAAAVPLQDPELAVGELTRAVTELGHVAVQIGARVNDLGLDDPGLEVFWDAAERLDVPVIVHPAELELPERIRRLFLHILVGNPAETTFAAAALMLGGVLEHHPFLRVLLVHGGGFVPYQIGRLDRGFTAAPPPVRARGTLNPRRLVERLYFDTVVHDDAALRHLVRFAAPGHVVLGSDYPFPMRLDQPLDALDAAGLDPADAEPVRSAAALIDVLNPATPAASPIPSQTPSIRSVPPRPDPGERWTA
jgi:aminocarboxymuconate-semialdehyde decarboxylase